MNTKSPWSRGLMYGGVFGGAIGVFVAIAALFGKAPLGEVALAAGITVLVWGALGFLAGFASHTEQHGNGQGERARDNDRPFFRRLLYRLVAGLLLSYIGAAVVFGSALAILFVWQPDLFAGTQRHSREENAVLFVGLFCVIGAEAGVVTGCWLGALLAPGGNELRSVAKVALPSAGLGALVGGWLAALVSLLQVGFGFQEEIMIIPPVTGGTVAGAGSAVLVRLTAFPRNSCEQQRTEGHEEDSDRHDSGDS
jgi:hypothetical protein